jgi:hypothetical protein
VTDASAEAAEAAEALLFLKESFVVTLRIRDGDDLRNVANPRTASVEQVWAVLVVWLALLGNIVENGVFVNNAIDKGVVNDRQVAGRAPTSPYPKDDRNICDKSQDLDGETTIFHG